MIQNLDDLVRFLRAFLNYDMLADPFSVPTGFPPHLARFYSEFGALINIEPSLENNFEAPFNNQDQFLPTKRTYKKNGLILFAMENQGSWSCACSIDPLDRKVYCDSELMGGPEGFRPFCSSIEDFIITLALQEVFFSCPSQHIVPFKELHEGLLRPIQSLWLGGVFVLGELTHDFFFDEELKLIGFSGPWGNMLATREKSVDLTKFVRPDN